MNTLRFVILIIVGFIWAAPAWTGSPIRHIVLIAGPKSHGPGEHEYEKSVHLLATLLNRAPNLSGIEAESYLNGWPDDPHVLDHAATIAFFSDGQDGTEENASRSPFMTEERMRLLAKQMQRGCGFVTFHFSVFAPERYAAQMLEWDGGYFDWQGGNGEGGFFSVRNDSAHEKWHSAIRVLQTDVELATPKHPIARGVSPFHVTEEFYYQLRFRENDTAFRPIMRVPALARDERDQIVAWAIERKDGGRGFGTSMGHFFDNWRNDDFRRLILNALVWTARAPVPKGGVKSAFPPEQIQHEGLKQLD